MFWKGEELKTVGDLMYKGIDKCDSREEAMEFMRLYRIENEYANENIGYIAGYYSREKADLIYDWFEVEHPIFGKTHPTPEEAIQAGLDYAKNGSKLAKKRFEQEVPHPEWELKAVDLLKKAGL